MGTACHHQAIPEDSAGGVVSHEILGDDFPTLLTEESLGLKSPINQEMMKGWMDNDEISTVSEGNDSSKQDRSGAIALDTDNDEGDGTENGQDADTCQESLPLVVTVFGAKGLREADWLPGTDRYFHCVLRTCPRRQDTATCQKTRAVKIVVDPMKDVVDPFWAVEDGIMEAQYVAGDSLEFDVVDTDGDGKGGLLGRAFLEAARFSERGFVGELPLEGAGAIFGTAATLSVEIMQPGRTRQLQGKKATDAQDSTDPIDPRSNLFALITEGKPQPVTRRRDRAEAFARQRIW
mmetsp:Transcript_45600/g.90432  ORF Transcript_45600/g.90432 Transcript_45600/m.90432 type:complete len:292 (+) Transcript_45600:148-1023(+)